MKKKVLFILINYNNSKEVILFVEKILKQKNDIVDADICIVNNTDVNEYKQIENKFLNYENISVLHSYVNLGYLNGAYYAYEKKYSEEYLYTIICNTDIEFENSNFLNDLTQVQYSREVMMVAPKIIRIQDKFNQNPFFTSKPTKFNFIIWIIAYNNNLFFYFYNQLSLLKKIIRIYFKRPIKAPMLNIYAAHGSFLILTNSFFSSLGTFKYPSFLFGEELFLANQIEKIGGSIIYDENLVVYHDEHSTTSKLKDTFKRQMMSKSNMYLYKNSY